MTSTHKTTKKKKISLRYLGVVALIGVAIVSSKVLISTFKVRNIVCQLDGQACPDALTKAISILQDKPLFFSNYEAVLSEKGIPLPVTLTNITKFLPHTLQLEFTSQTLAYMIKTNEGTIAVSTSGVLFKDSAISPPTTIEIKPELASILDDKHGVQLPIHTALLELVTALEKTDLSIKNITWVDKDTIILIMNDGQLKAILDAKNPRIAIEKLELIIKSQEYQAVEKTVQEIDLRFDLPVLRMRQ